MTVKQRLGIALLRLGTPLAADPDVCALETQNDKRLKLNPSYGHELITCEMSVYFDNIGLVRHLMEKYF